MTELHLDYETFAEVDLGDVGASRYSRHAGTEVLLLGFAYDDDKPTVVDLAAGERLPKVFLEGLRDPDVTKMAWNAQFELAITQNTLGEEVFYDEWYDIMVLAYTCSFPGKLEKVGPILGLGEDKKKDSRGKTLIRKFCGPRKPTKKEPWSRATYKTNPEEWEEFKEYNAQDVIAQRAIKRKLEQWDLPRHEWRNWFLDQEINNAGVPINMAVVNNAIAIYEELYANRIAEMKRLTGLDNPNSNAQLLGWLRENGYKYTDLKKAHVRMALDAGADDEDILRVLELRQETSKTSIKKFYALREKVDEDGVLRNGFQFAGAQRTWRFAGRGWQPQNLAKPIKELEDQQEQVVHHVEKLNARQIEMLYDKPMDVLSMCVRPVAQAPEGYLFADADLNAIENRVLGWIADDQKILDVFRKNQDPYLAFAVYSTGRPYDELFHEYKKLGNKKIRNDNKPPTLGCFGPETLVLTDRGLVPIIEVTCRDRVHDGIGFVSHDGVVNQGIKQTIVLAGVAVTPEHKILVGDEWKPAKDLAADSSVLNLALVTASGKLSDRLSLAATCRSIFADVIAALRPWFTEPISAWEKVENVTLARANNNEGRSEKRSVLSCMTSWRIGFTPHAAGVLTPETRVSTTTAAGALNAALLMLTALWRTAFLSSVLTALLKSTAQTTKGIMSREICGLVPAPSKWKIPAFVTIFNIMGRPTQLRDFTARLLQSISVKVPSCENVVKGFRPKKLYEIKSTAGARTVFDIVNAGPKHRFVIATAEGFLIVHNCGYMLSAGKYIVDEETGEKTGTGLLGYAQNMGIPLTVQQATHAVKVFRKTFTDVVDFWYDVEKAMKRTIKTGKKTRVGFITFDMSGPFCRMGLPSGRYLHYYKPAVRMMKKPWGDIGETVTYFGLNDKGNWGLITTHPGKITENADQAISRDLLVHGMRLAKKEGIDVRIHVHDQICGLVLAEEASDKLQILKECMSVVPKWAPGLILGAEGTTSKVFMKD